MSASFRNSILGFLSFVLGAVLVVYSGSSTIQEYTSTLINLSGVAVMTVGTWLFWTAIPAYQKWYPSKKLYFYLSLLSLLIYFVVAYILSAIISVISIFSFNFH